MGRGTTVKMKGTTERIGKTETTGRRGPPVKTKETTGKMKETTGKMKGTTERTGRMIETTERRGHPVKMRGTTGRMRETTERMRGTTETIEIILSKYKNHPFWKQHAHNHVSNKVF